jgi:hypothetical protein
MLNPIDDEFDLSGEPAIEAALARVRERLAEAAEGVARAKLIEAIVQAEAATLIAKVSARVASMAVK